MNRKELRVLAEKAQPGPWVVRETRHTLHVDAPVDYRKKKFFPVCTMSRSKFCTNGENWRYIAAANPSTVIALIRRQEVLEETLSDVLSVFRDEDVIVTDEMKERWISVLEEKNDLR